MGEIIPTVSSTLDRDLWVRVASKAPAVPQDLGELAWVEARLEQLEASQSHVQFERVRIASSQHLMERLKTQYQSDEFFRLRWSKTEFLFRTDFLVPALDDHSSYEMDIQTWEMDFLEARGFAYPEPRAVSHIEIRWTLWRDGMSPRESEEAARRLQQ